MAATTIKDIIVSILENSEYDFYGLRYDGAEYAEGETCNTSHQWWQDDPNEGIDETDSEYAPYNAGMHLWDGGELNGTCAIMINERNIGEVLTRMNMYKNCGDNLYLIAGDYAEQGYDIGEIIIRNATVIKKL